MTVPRLLVVAGMAPAPRLGGSDVQGSGRRVPICSVCGQRPVLAKRGEGFSCRNIWCSAADRPLGAVFWAGTYEGGLRRAILSYKYHSDLRWASVFARLLLELLNAHATWFEEYGVLCPVPSFDGVGARRPWGHIELVCAELSSRAGCEWPVQPLVRKVAETEPMSATSRPERRRIAGDSLSRSLVIAPGASTEGRKILVVDDVCASGQTLLAMARVLHAAGADEVAGLVLARALFRS